MLLELAEPVPVGFDGDFAEANWTFTNAAAYTMSGDTFSVSVAGGGRTASTTIQQDGTITFDWAINVTSAGQYGDSIHYTLNDVQTLLSAAGSASGTGVSIPVVAGDTFSMGSWGSANSSSYTASFSNFNFVAN